MPVFEELGPSFISPDTGFPHHEFAPSSLSACITRQFNHLFSGLRLAVSAAKTARSSPGETLTHLERAEREIDRGQEIVRMIDAVYGAHVPAHETIPIAGLAAMLESHGQYSTVSFIACPIDPSLVIIGDRGALLRAFQYLAGHILGMEGPGGRIGLTITGQWMAEGNALSVSAGVYVRFALEQPEFAGLADYLEDTLSPEAGSDLALAAGQSLIRRHGGTVKALFRDNRFTGLSVYLPGAREHPRHKEPAHPAPLTGAGRILLMDDEESIRTIGEILFTRLGFEITTVPDGAEAVRAYVSAREENRPYRVVIMDLTVPRGMGGKEAMAALREIDPEVRAIVSSGYSVDPVMSDYRTYGFRLAVEKPYRLETLVNAVKSLL